MALIDGKLYPPMSSKDNSTGQLRQPVELGQWEQAEENRSKAKLKNGKYYFDLKQADGRVTGGVAYNPYFHTSRSPLNDQFSAAYDKPYLVTVETEIPASELTSAPFEKNWHELAFKRMLRFAAENGYDKVAWTTGAQQARRYDLSKAIDSIELEHVGNNGRKMFRLKGLDYKIITDPDGKIHAGQDEFVGKNLADVVGKDVAKRMLEMEEGDIMEGEDLRIGGEGMRGFYDDMLPRFVSKYAKKWGAKVGEVTMPKLQEGYQTMHSVDVTEPMRESVMQGQPMFSISGEIGALNLDKAMAEEEEPKPIGHGEFGDIYDQFKGKPQEAIAFLTKKKDGEALGALRHNEIGDISIVYGNKAGGLEKIAIKHRDVLDNLQDVIDGMHVVRKSDNRIKLESDTHFAVVSRDYKGNPRGEWLLTAFEKQNSVPDNTMDTGETLSGERNDTATPQNTVSADKVTTNSSDSQNRGQLFSITNRPTIFPNETMLDFTKRYMLWQKAWRDDTLIHEYGEHIKILICRY